MSLRIGTDDLRPYDKTCDWTRMVTFRPGDAERVSLNPPRFSWSYLPDIFPNADDSVELLKQGPNDFSLAPALFTLQIARSPGFATGDMLLHIERTPYNFYNALPPFPVGQPVYWRVAYLTESGALRCWSAVRSFTVDPQALLWDRSRMLKLDDQPRPRLLASVDQGVAAKRPECNEILASVAGAEDVTKKTWWKNFPKTDRMSRADFRRVYPDTGAYDFTSAAEALAHLAFKRRMNGEKNLAEVAAQAAQIADYPIGGLSGPEGAPGSIGADVAQLPEFLSVIYDLTHDQATSKDRAALRAGIEWRLRYTFDNFACRVENGARIPYNSLAVSGSSHPFESGMGMFSAATLMAGDPDLSSSQREFFTRVYEFGLHWLVGITNGFGTEDGWNEGPGYGNSKMCWLTNAVCYYDLLRPELNMKNNPALKSIGEYFMYTSPLGLYAAPFGNGASKRDYVIRNRRTNTYRLAYLLNDGAFRQAWSESAEAMHAIGKGNQIAGLNFWRPWLCYALASRSNPPAHADMPSGVRLFSNSGWLCATTSNPNRLESFRDSAGMIVQARPVGGYQHSFYSDGSPQLWAFGEPLNFGSGTTANKEMFAYSPMSANTVLINGTGQRHLSHWHIDHFKNRRLPRQIARFAAYREFEGGVYALADLTHGYSKYTGPAGHWFGDMSGPYQNGPLPDVAQALRHIFFLRRRYFVFMDDYELGAGQSPAAFSWLWHVLKKTPVEIVAPGRVRYTAGEVRVDLAHVQQPDDLAFEDREGLQGALNPFTGEDYRSPIEEILKSGSNEALLMAHNFWFTTRTRTTRRRFCTVIYPTRAQEQPPQIESLSPLSVRVRGPHGEDVIDFSGAVDKATISVDSEALAKAANRTRRENA